MDTYPGAILLYIMKILSILYLALVAYTFIAVHQQGRNVNVPKMAAIILGQFICGIILAIYVLTLPTL